MKVNKSFGIPASAGRTGRESWIDWIVDRIDRLPGSIVIPYVFLFLTPILLLAIPVWTNDRSVSIENLRYYTLAGFWAFFPLALMHHLDTFSERALGQYVPVCDMSDSELSIVRWELTTMPAGPAAVAGLIGAGVILCFRIFTPKLFQVVQTTPAQSTIALIILCMNFAFQATLIYHTFRQLSLVSRIYRHAQLLDLFNLNPLYAFSALAARTAIAWALALYLTALLFPQGFLNSVTVGLTIFQGILVVVMFALPLVGIHQRIVSAKNDALREVGISLHRTLQELNQRAQNQKYDDIDTLNKLLVSLNTGRDILLEVPTWPWSPGTPLAVATVLFLPVFLFIIERLLVGMLGL